MNAVFIVAAMVCGTVLTRFLPFLIFPAGKELPGFVRYLSRTLPYAVMGLLVVYCLKNVSVFAGARGIPEALAVALIVFLHWWKGNSLLSIGVGTVFYMVLVQSVFVA